MCEYHLQTYPCGHSSLSRTQTCQTRKLQNQLDKQLNESPRRASVTTAAITTHHLIEPTSSNDEPSSSSSEPSSDESTDQDKVPKQRTCGRLSCTPESFNKNPLRTASRLVHSIHLSHRNYHIQKRRWHTLLLRRRLRSKRGPVSPLRALYLPTSVLYVPPPDDARRCKDRMEKGCARVLQSVEERIERAKGRLYRSLGRLGWLRGRFRMPRCWKDVVREVHFAGAELGALRVRVEGVECLG